MHGQLTFISALKAFLSIIAFLESELILVALRREFSLYAPSKLLLSNLATTDLCVGLIVEPPVCDFVTDCTEWTLEYLSLCSSRIFYHRPYFVWSFSVDTDGKKHGQTSFPVDGAEIQTSCNFEASLFNHYHLLATIVVSAVSFFCNSPIISWYVIFVISLCLVISTFSYTKIVFTIRHHQHQVQDHVQQPNQTNQLNIGRYRKAVSTALWLQFVLVTCYLPFAISLNLLFHLHLLPSLGVIFNFSFLKLVVKPDSLLLEEGRSETRTEGHNQASALLLIK